MVVMTKKTSIDKYSKSLFTGFLFFFMGISLSSFMGDDLAMQVLAVVLLLVAAVFFGMSLRESKGKKNSK